MTSPEDPHHKANDKNALIKVIIVAVISGFFTNIDRVVNVVSALCCEKKPIYVEGEWTGIYKESDLEGVKIRIGTESVSFDANKNQAEIITTQDKKRKRTMDYSFQNEVLISHYYASRDGKSGGVAYVLKGSLESEVLKGYWVGTDPENNGKLFVAPYVLAHGSVTQTDAERLYGEWFNQEAILAPE